MPEQSTPSLAEALRGIEDFNPLFALIVREELGKRLTIKEWQDIYKEVEQEADEIFGGKA